MCTVISITQNPRSRSLPLGYRNQSFHRKRIQILGMNFPQYALEAHPKLFSANHKCPYARVIAPCHSRKCFHTAQTATCSHRYASVYPGGNICTIVFDCFILSNRTCCLWQVKSSKSNIHGDERPSTYGFHILFYQMRIPNSSIKPFT